MSAGYQTRSAKPIHDVPCIVFIYGSTKGAYLDEFGVEGVSEAITERAYDILGHLLIDSAAGKQPD
jgi:hypothetical protein